MTSSIERASLTPPPLPRPPAWICALTTQTGPPSFCAASTASCTVNAGMPRGTGTPKWRKDFLALVLVDLHRALGAASGGAKARRRRRSGRHARRSRRRHVARGAQRRPMASRRQPRESRACSRVAMRRAGCSRRRQRPVVRSDSARASVAQHALDHDRPRSRAPARKRACARALGGVGRAAAEACAARTARGALELGVGERLRRPRATARRRAAPARAGCAGCRSAPRARARATRRSARPRGSGSPRASRAAASTSARRRGAPRRRTARRSTSARARSVAPQRLACGCAGRRAMRSSLRRSSSRLWSRCASSCSARAFSDRGALAGHALAGRSVLDDLQLGRRFGLRRRAAAGCPATRAPCSRSRAPAPGSRAGTRARCPCPGRSSRRCRRTRRRTSRAMLGVDAHVDDLAFAADALAVQDVELGGLERRRDLVLDDLDLGLVADRPPRPS